MQEGISPDMLLLCIDNIFKLIRLQIDSGILPVRLFSLKTKDSKFTKLPISEGISPDKPSPVRSIDIVVSTG